VGRGDGQSREATAATLDTAPPGAPLPSDQDASGRSFGPEELEALAEVLRSGVLTTTRGAQARRLERAVAALCRREHAVACASGTAAVGAALAALDLEPGAEVITGPITDMGAVAPILAHGLIPVFADTDPDTGMLTPGTVAAALSERTRAVIVTHLFGIPAPVPALRAVADRHGLALVEDCAQAWGAGVGGAPVGSAGDFACFSLQQGKHVTCGEGGVVVVADPRRARRARLWVDKGWPYGEADPDHEFLAPNARMSELQAAVANAQLRRLGSVVAARRETVAALLEAVAGVPGLRPVPLAPGAEPSWWRVPLLVDPATVPGGPDALAAALQPLGVPSAPRYIRRPAFACRVFTERRTFGRSTWPFTLARPEALDHDPARFAGTSAFLERVLVLPWNERYEPRHVEAVAAALARAVQEARR
jgi:dTDP-4-amino-4,6-dideoxygalactose transaminase